MLDTVCRCWPRIKNIAESPEDPEHSVKIPNCLGFSTRHRQQIIDTL